MSWNVGQVVNLSVDADEDEAFDSRETNALPRIDAARESDPHSTTATK